MKEFLHPYLKESGEKEKMCIGGFVCFLHILPLAVSWAFKVFYI